MKDGRRVTITLEFGTHADDTLLETIAYRVLNQANRTLMDSAVLDPVLPGKFEVTVEDTPKIKDTWLDGVYTNNPT